LPETEAGEKWLKGMAEVELPLEYKLKTIEETEDAKKKLLMPKHEELKILNIPGNYNQNFRGRENDARKRRKF